MATEGEDALEAAGIPQTRASSVAFVAAGVVAVGWVVAVVVHEHKPVRAPAGATAVVTSPIPPPNLSTGCNGANRTGCYDLGTQAEAESPPDTAVAATAYAMGCLDDGSADGRACLELGRLFAVGQGVIGKSDLLAASFYKRGCERGTGAACNHLGWRYFSTAQGLPKDAALGTAAFRRSCDLGHAPGCDSYAFALVNGIGTTADESRALSLFTDQCMSGTPEACMNAGFMTYYGRATTRSEGRARELWTRGCGGATEADMERSCLSVDVEPEECAIAALELQLAACGQADRLRASSLFTRACKDGWTWACRLDPSSTSSVTKPAR